MSSGLYTLTGILLFATGLAGAFVLDHALRKILALNIMGSGILLLLVSLAYRGFDDAADPVPHALVLTGIVVAVAATAVGLALAARLQLKESETDDSEGHG